MPHFNFDLTTDAPGTPGSSPTHEDFIQLKDALAPVIELAALILSERKAAAEALNVEPVPEPVIEPVVDVAPEPVADPIPETVADAPVVEPVVEATVEPVADAETDMFETPAANA